MYFLRGLHPANTTYLPELRRRIIAKAAPRLAVLSAGKGFR
jgi:hypothetical protein